MANTEGAARHFELYKTDPDKAHRIDAMGNGQLVTTLLLTMTGRKSGEKRTTPLIYTKVGDDYILVASMAGAPTHPIWYLNLEANPDCHIQVARDHHDARARIANDQERAALWPKVVAHYPDYEVYQARTERQIPVVILETVKQS